MAVHLERVSEIAASQQEVWAVLTDLGGWESWNPTCWSPVASSSWAPSSG